MIYKFNKIYIFVLVLLCCGCATPYTKLGKNGGYSDKKISPNRYEVSFQGNTRTSDEKVRKYFLRRCAEIAQQNNYTYFVITQTSDKTIYTTVVEEGSPQTKAKITAMSYSGQTAFRPTEHKIIPKHLIEGTIALYNEGNQPSTAIRVNEILKNTSSQMKEKR